MFKYNILVIPSPVSSIDSQTTFPSLTSMGLIEHPYHIKDNDILEHENTIYTVICAIHSNGIVKLVVEEKQNSINDYAFRAWKKAMNP